MRTLNYLSVFIIGIINSESIAQATYLGYMFIPTAYGNYSEITDGTISTAIGNDGAENINLPFPFEYMGITYSTARISVNGWIEMGQTYTAPGAFNELESTVKKPLICPLWSDLYADSQSEIRYETIGEYPARIFVIQWKDLTWYDGSPLRKSFQVRIWELDGTIDFVYGPGTSSGSQFSVGMNNHIGGTGNFISVTPMQFIYNFTVSTTTANNYNYDLSLLPENLTLSFVPQQYHYYGSKLYQTPDSVFVGNQNQKIIAIIIPSHDGGALTPPQVLKFYFNTYGTTNLNDIVNVKLFSTGSSPYFSNNHQIGETYTNPSGLFEINNITGAYLINNATNYYWLAYDISAEATAGNLVDGNCYKIDLTGPPIYPDSLLTDPKLVIIENTFPTNLSIGLSGDFLTITEAIQSLENQSISSPTILELLNTYNATNEIFPIEIPFINGSSQNNIITIRPAQNATNINLISNTIIFTFQNATFTTIDGRPGGIGEEKEISLINTSLSSSTILFLDSTHFNTIMYCNILGSDTSSTDGVVSFKPYNNTNNTLANCLIANYDNNLPSFGIKIFNDFQSGQGGSHHTVINCEIKNFKKAGIEIHIADNSSLIGNIIHNEFEVSSNSLSGINCYARHVTISKCKIYNLISSELNSNDVYGIKIPRGWGGVVDNNFISLSGNEQSSITGIYLKGELFIGYFFYYNSINIFGNCESSEGSSCLKRDWTLTENPSLYPPWYLLNNILVNNRVNTSGNGIHLAIDSNDPYYSADYDYNNYYVTPPNNYIGKWINTYASNIEEWKILSNRDPNSVSTDVNFVSDTDLHLTGGSIGDSLLIGIPISGITTDIDGELRHLISPYKGADEVDSPVFTNETNMLPSNFALFQNYPNPFNPSTKIKYTIPASLNPSKGRTLVQLRVYDILGREVKVLVNEEKQSGVYEIEFDGSSLSGGVYFYRLTARDPSTGSGQRFSDTKKLVLIK
ncbi:MAG: hypothetical protein DAHOPDDO_01017 [Ignavibacteriaceae bacterium]|nr:hypothetical protein [Ignavibacteriaceae bacterium]